MMAVVESRHFGSLTVKVSPRFGVASNVRKANKTINVNASNPTYRNSMAPPREWSVSSLRSAFVVNALKADVSLASFL
jgi:hypothetical protein